jgi:DNA-binding MarR family transcriptional regulator
VRLMDEAGVVEQAATALAALLDKAADLTPAISPTQLRVLKIVHDSPGLTVNGLAEALGVVASSASRLCDRLEALGLLHRATDGADRREVQLRLTSQAADVLAELRQRRQDALAAVLRRMAPAARQELLRALGAFTAAARECAARQHAAGKQSSRPEVGRRTA